MTPASQLQAAMRRAPWLSQAVRMTLRKSKGRPALRMTYSVIDARTLRPTGDKSVREPDPLYALRVLRLNTRAPQWPPMNLRNTPEQAAQAWISRHVAYGAAVSNAYDPVRLP